MILLGLRLTLRGGRETVVRLLLLMAAVGLGTGLLLAAISGINAVNAQNDVGARPWAQNSAGHRGATAPGATLWWNVSYDTFRSQGIGRVDAAATGPAAPVPPGIPHDPGPGQYYASPALAALLRSTPADELADRFPGHLIGTIEDAGLPSPGALAIIIGHTPAQLARTPDTARLTPIPTKPARGGREGAGNPDRYLLPWALPGIPPDGIDLVLSVVALALLTPVLIFITTATRLSAARREQRFAAMRLVGATRRQVSQLAAVESMLAAIGGVAAGFGIFFLLRDPLSAIPFTGAAFFPAQMSLSVPDVLAVALGIPAAGVVAARLALRRVHVSPLGVARRVTPRPPRAWRLLPLLAGVAELGFFVVRGHPASVPGQVQAFFSGFLLVVIGLIIAGPWLTMAGARFMARRARRPGALIAARRLADDPRAGFRAVSGLVLALFMTTVAVAALTTEDAKTARPGIAVAAANVLVDQLGGVGMYGQDASTAPPVLPETVTAHLRGIDGVTGVVEVRAHTGLTVLLSGSTAPAGLVSCAQLASVPVLGRCPAGAQVAVFPFDPTFTRESLAGITWPAVHIAAQRLNAIGLDTIDVATGGPPPAIERARTVLAAAYPVQQAPETLGEWFTGGDTQSNAYQQLADVVVLASLPIAGCTLAASIAGGLADRKRPFSMLRLAGARLATLRRVVLLESAVPLLAAAVVAIGAGFGASALYASAEMHHPLVAPGAEYYVITVAGVAASLAIIAATFPLLRRITGPEVARNE
jgi:hypothetical protein